MSRRNTCSCECERGCRVCIRYLHLDLSFSEQEGTPDIKGLILFAKPSDTIFYLLGSRLVTRSSHRNNPVNIQHAVSRKCLFTTGFSTILI